MKRILRCAALAAAASSGAAAAADGPDCGGWNTQAFFETAAAADVDICLNGGADVNARDKLGLTPLFWAAWFNSNPAVIAALADAGADIEARDVDGQTPLHLAAGGNSNPGVITELLRRGADGAARAEGGRTAWGLAQANDDLRGSDALAVFSGCQASDCVTLTANLDTGAGRGGIRRDP